VAVEDNAREACRRVRCPLNCGKMRSHLSFLRTT
jgi:hypothetical protein